MNSLQKSGLTPSQAEVYLTPVALKNSTARRVYKFAQVARQDMRGVRLVLRISIPASVKEER